jgi:hypothetical protein
MSVDVLNVGRGVITDFKKTLRPTKLKLIEKDVILNASFVWEDLNRTCIYYRCDEFPDLLKEEHFWFDFSTFDDYYSNMFNLGRVKYKKDIWLVDNLKKESYEILFPKRFFDEINIVEYRSCVQYVLDRVCGNGVY